MSTRSPGTSRRRRHKSSRAQAFGREMKIRWFRCASGTRSRIVPRCAPSAPLLFGWRPLGSGRASSSFFMAGASVLGALFCSRRASFCSSQVGSCLVGMPMPQIQFQVHLGSGVIQEVAIVGMVKYGAREPRKGTKQTSPPIRRPELVGGFVQQQHVGLGSNRRRQATRRFSPPESLPITASQGGRRRGIAAISSKWSPPSPAAAMMASSLFAPGRRVKVSVSPAYAAYTSSGGPGRP